MDPWEREKELQDMDLCAGYLGGPKRRRATIHNDPWFEAVPGRVLEGTAASTAELSRACRQAALTR